MESQKPTEDVTGRQTRNKRARLVCVVCHDKKIKCDLQNKTGQESGNCTNCTISGNHCRLRPSKRGKHRRTLAAPSSLESLGASSLMMLQSSVEPQLQLLTPAGTTASNEDSINRQPNLIDRGPGDSTYSSLNGKICYQPQRTISTPSTVQVRDFHRQSSTTDPSDRQSGLYETQATGQSHAPPSYLGETGFLPLFAQPGVDTSNASSLQPGEKDLAYDLPPPSLQESFAETYFDYCYAWCPVIENDDLDNDLATGQSPILKHALGLAASQIQPPVISHAKPDAYYDRAKRLFYNNGEKNPITCIKAIILFYWWNPVAPNTVSIDSVWWWTGTAIRLAQQIGLHRELKPGQPMGAGVTPGLRRRIWWTLFSRERVTSLCQGRPCVIDPEDCNISEPSLDDFPEPRDSRAEVFVNWVRLCGIMGRVGKYLSRNTEYSPFPAHLAAELIDWVRSLPDHLRLPIASNRTTTFNRDVHQLHLPYLTTITILHLSRSSRPLPIPKAYTAAVLAASCVARIFEDFLARGHIRFLAAMNCWYVGVAILALLHARQVEYLTKSADEDIKILQVALKELGTMWPVAKMFDRGFERLFRSNAFPVGDGEETGGTAFDARPPITASSPGLADLSMSNGVDWMHYFPYATMQTSALASILLAGNQEEPFPILDWPSDFTFQLQDLFDPSDPFPSVMPI